MQFRVMYGSMWNIYIFTPTGLVECFYVAFPRLCQSGLIAEQKEQLAQAYAVAVEIAARFEADARFTATEQEIKKAFNRSFV